MRPRLPARWSTLARRGRGHAFDSGKLAIGYVAQLVLQLAYFLIVTRMLGASGFGPFAATLAAIALASPLAGFGFSEVALVRVSQDRDQTARWLANSLAVSMISGFALACLLGLLAAGFSSLNFGSLGWLPAGLVFALAFVELVLVRGCLVIGRVYQARRQITQTAAINVMVPATKTAAALAAWLIGGGSLILLVGLLAAQMLMALGCLYVGMVRRSALVRPAWKDVRSELSLAFSFAGGLFCKTTYSDADKLMLARWSTDAVVGTYAAGHKILSLAFTPIRAVLEATWPRQLELAKQDPAACWRFSLGLLGVCVGIGTALGGTLFLLASWLPVVLGPDFEASVAVLKLGFALPILQATHYTLGNYLTAMNRQGVRAAMQFLALALYLTLGVYAISNYSWQGAIWTCLISESWLAVSLAAVCVWVRRQPSTIDVGPSLSPAVTHANSTSETPCR